jgi:hypothetical protein
MGKMTKAELAKAMHDPIFRLSRSQLYWIVTKTKDRHGRDVSDFGPFIPLPVQSSIFEAIYTEGKRKLLIPKARREGCSTGINLSQLDFCIYNKDFHSRIVDQSENDATDKLVNRVQKAWTYIKDTFQIDLQHTGMSAGDTKWNNGSRFSATISGRGGDAAHFLHVSELGPIDFKDAKRADEIIDGALPAADAGITVIESTAKGPMGHFKRLVDNALEVKPEDRTADDWEVLFFAWFDDPRHYLLGKESRIRKKTHDYLDYIESKTGKTLTLEQRIWYQVMSEKTSNMKYEYPSLLEECWDQPIEGAIYATLINEARSDNRVGKFPHDPRLPVCTIWDLGSPENTRCVFFQQVMGEIRLIDAQMGGYSEDLKEDGPRKVSDWVKLIKAKPYGYASHILPHDGNITTSTGTTFRADLIKLGLTDVRVMQRIKNAIWNRINATQESFERMVFNTDSPGITVMLKHLSMYHTKTENDGLTIKQMPHGDFSSHYADAFGSITEAIDKGYTYSGSGYSSANKKKRKLKIKKFSAY